MSDELIAALKQRVALNYYGRPEVIEIIARAVTERVRGAGGGVQGTTAPRRVLTELNCTP